MGHDEATASYLFDFIYLDREKIGSYYAQLFDDGVLTSIKRSASSQDTSTDSLGVGVPKLLGGEMKNSETAGRSLERQFDTAWTVPVDVINELYARGFITTDIMKASLGQLVMFSGRMQVIDLRMVQEMWEPVVSLMSRNSGAENKTNTALRKAEAAQKEEMKVMVKIFSKLPHTLQMRMFSDDAQLWSTLNPTSLTINSDDLTFKHGAGIPGNWIVIGTVDALPDSPDDFALPKNINDVESGMLQMMIALRTMLGRHESDYGITPIAVFRSIAPAVEAEPS